MRVLSVAVAFLITVGVLAGTPLGAQSQTAWSEHLIGRPLYLRGAWSEDKIEFDPAGKPVTAAHRGSLTLSGIDVSSVKISDGSLVLHGQRVALVASAPGEPLMRVPTVSSTTMMPLTHHKEYKANEPVQFIIHADAQADFTAALHAIFVDGLAQLAITAPGYWRCYAAAYFVDAMVSPTASDDVLHCAEAQSKGVHPATGPSEEYAPVAVLHSFPVQIPPVAAQLHLKGVTTVYADIDTHNRPFDFQVIQAIGAGMDEVALDAMAHFTFRAAAQDGTPVAAGFKFSMQVGPN